MDKQTTHLEFIQANIARMNQCSFQMKGWMVTIVSALLALFAASKGEQRTGNVIYIFIAIVPTILFWILDSYYLQQERKFRGIYNAVIKVAVVGEERIEIEEFEMPLHKFTGGKYNFFRVLTSMTEILLYLPIIIGLVIAGLMLR